jgi:hypothetical protein
MLARPTRNSGVLLRLHPLGADVRTVADMTNEEILTARFARMGLCPVVTSRLKTDDSSQVLTVAAAAAAATDAIGALLAQIGTVLVFGEETIGIVKTGFFRMNPAVVRVRCTEVDEGTSLDVQGSAKEGLIRQRGGHQAVQEFVERFLSLVPVEWMA